MITGIGIIIGINTGESLLGALGKATTVLLVIFVCIEVQLDSEQGGRVIIGKGRGGSACDFAAHAYIFEIDLPLCVVDGDSEESIWWHLRKDVFHGR
jgi:hypothetical protein